MDSRFPDHPFWDFSLSVYGTDGVPPACLALQERYGVDVNLLLWCLWLGVAGHPRLTGGDLETVSARIDGWHHTVVRHLRDLRQRLKTPDSGIDSELQQSLRARIQKIEIDAEHIEQLALGAAAEALADTDTAAGPALETSAHNAALYLAETGASGDEADCASLGKIAAAAYPDQSPEAVQEAVADALGDAAR